jgi:hypothetical protein
MNAQLANTVTYRLSVSGMAKAEAIQSRCDQAACSFILELQTLFSERFGLFYFNHAKVWFINYFLARATYNKSPTPSTSTMHRSASIASSSVPTLNLCDSIRERDDHETQYYYDQQCRTGHDPSLQPTHVRFILG